MKEIKTGYFLIAEYGNYAVIVRDSEFEPYVVANGLQEDDTWNYGHYFRDLFDAVTYALTCSNPEYIPYHRLSEIATRAIDGLFEFEEDAAYEYCENELELAEEEMEYFGVEPKYEE